MHNNLQVSQFGQLYAIFFIGFSRIYSTEFQIIFGYNYKICSMCINLVQSFNIYITSIKYVISIVFIGYEIKNIYNVNYGGCNMNKNRNLCNDFKYKYKLYQVSKLKTIEGRTYNDFNLAYNSFSPPVV